jgi:hypothetical protein
MYLVRVARRCDRIVQVLCCLHRRGMRLAWGCGCPAHMCHVIQRALRKQ